MNEKYKITVYSAEASNRFILSHLYGIIKDLPQAHELGIRLFKRNLKALYRQSFLGFGWAFLLPLATAALWIFLRGNNIISVGDTSIAYPVFVFTGTVLWQVFAEAVSAPLTQVNENRSMLSKINIPREGLLLSGAYQWLFNTLIKFLLLTLIYLYFRQEVKLVGLLLAWLGIGAIGLVGFSIGLVLTPIGMLYKDIDRGIAIVLPFFMYLTPVVYPPLDEGMFGFIMKWNPLSTLIVQTRNWLTGQPVTDMQLFLIWTLVFAIIFLISLVIYRLTILMAIERMGS